MGTKSHKPPMTRGDEITLTIESLADRGMGLARVDGFVVFVRYAAPGDRVKVVVVNSRRSYAEAKVVEVLDRGPARVAPRCRYFGSCGGCSLQHVAYAAQLLAKKNAVMSAVRQATDAHSIPVRDPLPSADAYYYRNKMEFSFSAHRWLTREEIASGALLDKSFALGLHVPGNFYKVLDLKECFLQSESSTQILCGLRALALKHNWEAWNIRKRLGFLRHLVIREATATDDLMVNLVTSFYDPARMEVLAQYLRTAHPQVTTLVNTINDTPRQAAVGAAAYVVFGSGVLREQIGPYRFEISPGSFFQTNTRQAETLCKLVHTLGAFQPDDLALDLYCGAGTFAIYIASSVRRVVGIELVPDAIAAARRNAAANNIDNCTFVAGDMLKVFTTAFLRTMGNPDVVTVNPPRAGMHPKVVRRLATLKPRRIVYVSCNPRSQAHDLASLLDHYRVEVAQPVDLFPQTHHIENVALLVAR